MAWWRERVVAPARRAWLAVARRARGGAGSTGVVDLRRDVQTCGYGDVQVMWNMLSSEQQDYGFRPPAPEKPPRRRQAFCWRPSFGHLRTPRRATAAI